MKSLKYFSKFKKHKLIFIVTLLFWLASLFGLLLMARGLISRNKVIAEQRAELQKDVALMRGMQQVRRSVLSSLEEQSELFDLFIDEDTIPIFLGTLESIGARAGVVHNINRVDRSSSRDRLIVGVRVGGDFANIHHYVKMVETSPYKLEVSRLIMQKNPTTDLGEDMPSWSADIELILLSYSDIDVPAVVSDQ